MMFSVHLHSEANCHTRRVNLKRQSKKSQAAAQDLKSQILSSAAAAVAQRALAPQKNMMCAAEKKRSDTIAR